MEKIFLCKGRKLIEGTIVWQQSFFGSEPFFETKSSEMIKITPNMKFQTQDVFKTQRCDCGSSELNWYFNLTKEGKKIWHCKKCLKEWSE